MMMLAGVSVNIILTSPAPHMLTTDSETLRARSESSDSHRTRGRLTAVTMIPALQDTEQHFQCISSFLSLTESLDSSFYFWLVA